MLDFIKLGIGYYKNNFSVPTAIIHYFLWIVPIPVPSRSLIFFFNVELFNPIQCIVPFRHFHLQKFDLGLLKKICFSCPHLIFLIHD